MDGLSMNDQALDTRGTMTCPNCDHELSMFAEPDPDVGERRATVVAEVFASWRFPVLLLVAVAAWVLINVIARPIEPYHMAMVGILGATLGTNAACQGPLILLTQRRSAMRDRKRDRATYLVAANTEADLHDVRNRLVNLTVLVEGQVERER
jgi:uncharacterized membrane protein